MRAVLFVSLLFTVNAIAAEYKIEGKMYSFKAHQGIEVFCQKPGPECLAENTVKSLTVKNSRPDKFGGSEFCLKELQIQTVLGVNKAGDGRAFCVFKDSSLIEVNSLGAFLGPR